MRQLMMFLLVLGALATAPRAEAADRQKDEATAKVTGKIQEPAEDSVLKKPVFKAKGTLTGTVPRGHAVFIILEDMQFNRFFVQPPAVSAARGGQWTHSNLRAITEGDWRIHLVLFDPAGTGALKALIKAKDFRGLEELPDSHKILASVSVRRSNGSR